MSPEIKYLSYLTLLKRLLGIIARKNSGKNYAHNCGSTFIEACNSINLSLNPFDYFLYCEIVQNTSNKSRQPNVASLNPAIEPSFTNIYKDVDKSALWQIWLVESQLRYELKSIITS